MPVEFGEHAKEADDVDHRVRFLEGGDDVGHGKLFVRRGGRDEKHSLYVGGRALQRGEIEEVGYDYLGEREVFLQALYLLESTCYESELHMRVSLGKEDREWFADVAASTENEDSR